MLLVVGDTRVQHIGKAFSDVERKKYDVVCLSKPGARISQILELLNQFKEEEKKKPLLVVIVGLVGDVLLKKNGTGYPSITLREGIYNKNQEYPALGGIVQMRKNVEDKIEGMWPGVRIIWILPFPIDLSTFAKSQATQPVPRHVECSLNRMTLDLNNYMSGVDKTFQRGEAIDWDVLPWFSFWKDVSSQKPGAPCEFKEFMAKIRKGERVPSLLPESSLDGFHPQVRTSQGLIRAIIRKYGFTVRNAAKPQEPSRSASPSGPQKVEMRDQATQVDYGVELPEEDRVFLPCKHHSFFAEKKEDQYLCKKCGGLFHEKDMFLFCKYNVYRLKPDLLPELEKN